MKIIDTPSPNFDARPQGQAVDMLVLHYTGMKTMDEALARLSDAEAKVSAHYLIDEDGAIHRLVAEDKRAWHAGVSSWRGYADINARSIGVELVNPGHEFGYRPFPEAQMAALILLAKGILARLAIPPRNVVAHADVAPSRKQDPGELFDWQRLAQAGIGVWPGRNSLERGQGPRASLPASGSLAPPARPAPEGHETTSQAGHMVSRLSHYGYDVSDADAAILAFQRHFRPARTDGIADAEGAGILDALLKLVQE
ncbi:MAG: N-acetylmuramoyl-L-alanine amidase [Rhodospirillales bacterium]|nr:N-acetylmuramoyl-L-alanine amidase [Rhodospirillales bacterium]